MEAKEMPTTKIAGSTSKVSFHPTIQRTSQNGTIIAVSGRIRPIIAFMSASGNAETAASMCTGVPIAPQASGAVLAIRLSAAAWNGLNPKPIMNAPAIATGDPNPAQPSMKAPNGRATNVLAGRKLVSKSQQNLQHICFRDSREPDCPNFPRKGRSYFRHAAPVLEPWAAVAEILRLRRSCQALTICPLALLGGKKVVGVERVLCVNKELRGYGKQGGEAH